MRNIIPSMKPVQNWSAVGAGWLLILGLAQICSKKSTNQTQSISEPDGTSKNNQSPVLGRELCGGSFPHKRRLSVGLSDKQFLIFCRQKSAVDFWYG